MVSSRCTKSASNKSGGPGTVATLPGKRQSGAESSWGSLARPRSDLHSEGAVMFCHPSCRMEMLHDAKKIGSKIEIPLHPPGLTLGKIGNPGGNERTGRFLFFAPKTRSPGGISTKITVPCRKGGGVQHEPCQVLDQYGNGVLGRETGMIRNVGTTTFGFLPIATQGASGSTAKRERS